MSAPPSRGSKPGAVWAVQTTKRKKPTTSTEPQTQKKRQRLSLRDPDVDEHTAPNSAPQRSNKQQKTLTQIQFPLRSSREGLEGGCETEVLEPIISAAGNEDSEKISRRKSGPRPIASIGKPKARLGKRQRSTLTQMDFLKLHRNLGEDADDGDFSMIGADTAAGGEQCGGGDISHAITEKGNVGSTRKGAGAADIGNITAKRKRRKFSPSQMEDDGELQGTPPNSTIRRQPTTLSVPKLKSIPKIRDEAETPLRPTRQTRSAAKANAKIREAVRQYSIPSFADKENVDVSGLSPVKGFGTPKRRRDIIPSSQSPDGVLSSSGRSTVLAARELRWPPLQQQSSNVSPTAASRFKNARAIGRGKMTTSPKRKICVLKYGPRKRSPRDKTGVQLCDHNPKLGTEQSLSDLEIPETSEPDQPRVIPSSQTDSEAEPEVPETSQGLRRNTSTPSTTKCEYGSRILSSPQNTPVAVACTRPIEFDTHVRGKNTQVASLFPLDQARSVGAVSGGYEQLNDVAAASHTTPVRTLLRTRTLSTVDDSQAGEENVATGANPLPSLNVVSIQRGDGSNVMAAPQTSSSLSDLALDLAPPSYLLKTTTSVPTKLPYPSFPSSPIPDPTPLPQSQSAVRATAATQTQRSIHPASLPRPSQVSTQSPTQNSWLPLSSLPTQNKIADLSSPTDAALRVIKVKDSESMPVVALRDIASHSQLEGRIWGHGADAWIDAGLGDPDLDEDLDPKSSPPLPSPSTLARRQIVDPMVSKALTHSQVPAEEPFHGHQNMSPGTIQSNPFPTFIHHRHSNSQPKSPSHPEYRNRDRIHHHSINYHDHDHNHNHNSTSTPTPHTTSALTSQPNRKDKDTYRLPNGDTDRIVIDDDIDSLLPPSRLHLPDSLLESLPGPPSNWAGWAAGTDGEEYDQLRFL